jgi:hypothetical protein
MIFPEKFIAGETVQYPGDGEFFSPDTDYPAPTWSMSVVVVGPSKATYAATTSGSEFNFEIDTSNLQAGFYKYQAYVTDGTDKHYLDDYSGTFTLEAALADQDAGFDARTHAKKMVDAIEAILEGRASKEHLEMTYAGRTLKRHSFAQLYDIKKKYEGEIARANIRKRGTFKTIGARF